MIKTILLTLSFLAFGSYGLLSQANLALEDCRTLKASFEPLNTISTSVEGTYSFVLEKEILPNLWQKVKVTESKKREVLFTGLSKADYRVTVVSTTPTTGQKTKMYHRLLVEANANISLANTFLSNVVTLQLDADCNFWYENQARENKVNSQSPVVIYPNPSQDRLWVEWTTFTEVTEISLYSLTGTLLKKVTPNKNNTELDISDLLPGVYLLKVSNDEQLIVSERISVLR